MLHLVEERQINAADKKVFDIIADLDTYKDWNPWVVDASGSVAEGDMLQVQANMSIAKNSNSIRTQTFKHKMLAAQSPTLFHWCDVGWFTLFAYGHRKRTITAIDENCCAYKVELQVTGIGAGLANLLFGKFMRSGLKAETDALKNHAESL